MEWDNIPKLGMGYLGTMGFLGPWALGLGHWLGLGWALRWR